MVFPRVEAIFGGGDDFREPIEIDVEEFIGVKSFKAKGKRISNYEVKEVKELEPTRFPEPEEEGEKPSEIEIEAEEPINDADLLDEITGQMSLFD